MNQDDITRINEALHTALGCLSMVRPPHELASGMFEPIDMVRDAIRRIKNATAERGEQDPAAAEPPANDLLDATVLAMSPFGVDRREAQMRRMAERFLAWKLPADFNPDGGITFEKIAGANGPQPFTREPVGTNLLTFSQALEMVRYMMEGLPTKVFIGVDLAADVGKSD